MVPVKVLNSWSPIGGPWVGYQMSSASVSPVSTSETPSSSEDRFTCGNCGINLVLIRARLLFSQVPPVADAEWNDGGRVG